MSGFFRIGTVIVARRTTHDELTRGDENIAEAVFGVRSRLTRPNGVNTNYSYDAVSHLLGVLHQAGTSTLDGASYTYDAAGNRTAKTNYLNSTTSNYSYDPLYELMPAMDRAGKAVVTETTFGKWSADLVRAMGGSDELVLVGVSTDCCVLSTALASLIADSPEAARVAGPAAADLTRLALSPYDIWRDIFSTNAGEIDRVIGDAIARLQTLRENLLSESDMQATFARAAEAASKLRQS